MENENCAISLYMKEECCEKHLFCIDGNLNIDEIIEFVSKKIYNLDELELCELDVEILGNTKVSKKEIYDTFKKFIL